MARACLTPEELATKAEMPRATLNNVLTGKSVRPATLGRVARALGVRCILLCDGHQLKSTLQTAGCQVAEDLEDVIRVANAIAPEHLELCVDDPFRYLGEIRHAGSVFLGNYSPEPLGDYFAGPNHVLPTSGTARFFSPLSVDSFIKKSSFIYYTEDALRADAQDVIRFADTEGLTAHANSIKVRFDLD